MDPEGTEETIKNIMLADIENYYKNYMTSNGAKLVVVGDIKQEDFLPKLAFLDKLPNKKIVLPKPAAAPKWIKQRFTWLMFLRQHNQNSG